MRQSQLWNKCAMRANSVHVRHAIVEVNVVIGVLVVHGELLVFVRVVPVFLDCDAVVLIHFRSHSFSPKPLFSSYPFYVGFCCIGCIVFTPPVGDSKLLLAVTEF